MRQRSGWLLAGGLAASLLAVPFAQADAAGVGMVNIRKVIAQSRPGREARASLNREKKRLEDSIRGRRAKLEKLAQDARALQVEIEQKSAIWREEERDKKIFDLRGMRRSLARERDNLKRLVQESQRDLADRERKVITQVIREIRDVVRQYGKAQKFDLIIDSTVILYTKPAVDVTNKVIERYNRQKK